MIKSIWLYLERWFPQLIIKRALTFSRCLEEDTGFSLKVVDGEEGLMFFLIDPYGDGDNEDSGYWSNLDDAIFDLSDFEKSQCLEHLVEPSDYDMMAANGLCPRWHDGF